MRRNRPHSLDRTALGTAARAALLALAALLLGGRARADEVEPLGAAAPQAPAQESAPAAPAAPPPPAQEGAPAAPAPGTAQTLTLAPTPPPPPEGRGRGLRAAGWTLFALGSGATAAGLLLIPFGPSDTPALTTLLPLLSGGAVAILIGRLLVSAGQERRRSYVP